MLRTSSWGGIVAIAAGIMVAIGCTPSPDPDDPDQNPVDTADPGFVPPDPDPDPDPPGDGMGRLVVSMSDGTVNLLPLSTPPLPPVCHTLDFETDANGDPILAGQFLEEVYGDWGVHITVADETNDDPGWAIAFDSSNPTGGDPDLGTPNSQYGGPGQGSHGETNDTPLGNLLISAEDIVDADGDGLVDDPDDEGGGAFVTFDFDVPVCLDGLDLIDVEDTETPTRFVAFAPDGTWLEQVDAGGLGDNSVENHVINRCNVGAMMVQLRASGGLDNLEFCEDQGQGPPALDLDDVDSVYFTVNNIALDASGAETLIAQETFFVDVLQPGPPQPVTVASAKVPVGDYTGVRFALSHAWFVVDGEAIGIPGWSFGDEPLDAPVDFTVEDCGITRVDVTWTADILLAPDLSDLDLVLTLDGLVTPEPCGSL